MNNELIQNGKLLKRIHNLIVKIWMEKKGLEKWTDNSHSQKRPNELQELQINYVTGHCIKMTNLNIDKDSEKEDQQSTQYTLKNATI